MLRRSGTAIRRSSVGGPQSSPFARLQMMAINISETQGWTESREQPALLPLLQGDGQPDPVESRAPYNYQTDNAAVSLTLPFSLALLTLLGALNLYMLWLLRRGGASRISQATTRVLLSMGVADLAVCVTGAPALFLSDLAVPLPFYTCLVLNCMILGGALVSSLHHVLLAYYRWTLLTQPFRCRVTRASTFLHLFLCWLAGVAVSSLPYMGFNNYTNLQSYSAPSSSNYGNVHSFLSSRYGDRINGGARNTTAPSHHGAAMTDLSLLRRALPDETLWSGTGEDVPEPFLTFTQPATSFPCPNSTFTVPAATIHSEEAGSAHSRPETAWRPSPDTSDARSSLSKDRVPLQNRNRSDHAENDQNHDPLSHRHLFPTVPPPPFLLNCRGPASQCLVPCLYQNVLSLGYLTYVIFLGSVGLPLLVVAILYFSIFRLIRHHCLSRQNSCPGATPAPGPSPSPSPANLLFYHRQRRVACLTILLFSVYFLSRLPFNILNAVMYACPSCYVPQWAPPIALLSTVFSAGSNPLLYVMKSRAGVLEFTRSR